MKLIDNIYKILTTEVSANKFSFTIELNPGCDIYQGHFPQNPITPGVVMIGIARELIENVINTPLKLTKVPSVKYTAILSPTQHTIINYTIDCMQNSDDTVKAKAAITDGGETFARISLELQPDNS